MLNTLFAKIASVLAVPLVVILSLAGYNLNQPQTDYSAFIKSEIERYAKESQTLGADNVLPVGGATYNLSGAGISSSATSFTLASFTLPQNGYKLTDADVAPGSSQAYFTLEPGNRTRQEFVGCTTVVQNVSGTATISGCTRGLSPIQPYTASTSLQFAHSGSAQVILSNPPQQQNLYAAKDNDETITGIYTFASTSPARYASVPAAHQTGTHASTTAEFASVALVNAVTTAGAPDASETAQGLVELATQSEAASSTSSGTEARLVLGGNIATDTPNVGTSASRVLMSDMFGKLKQGWLDLTQQFNFSGGLIASNATSTAATTTSLAVSGSTVNFNGTRWSFPSLFGASSTVPLLSSSGQITYDYPGSRLTSFVGTLTGATTTNRFDYSNNTSMLTGHITFPSPMLIRKVTIRPLICTTPGTFDVGLYTGDGQTLVFSTTTKSISGANVDTSTLTPPVLVDSGDYYVAIVTNGTTQCFLQTWGSSDNQVDEGATGEPVWSGATTVSAGVLPSTFSPTAAGNSDNSVPYVRFDD